MESRAIGDEGCSVSYNINPCMAMKVSSMMVMGWMVCRDRAYHVAKIIMPYSVSIGNDTHTPSIVAPGNEAIVFAPLHSSRAVASVAWSSQVCGMFETSQSCMSMAMSTSGVSNGVSSRLDNTLHRGM